MPEQQSYRKLKNLGLGILSWRGHDSLRSTLTSYKEAGIFDYFGEILLFLPEIDDLSVKIAEEFGLPYKGTPNNLGIMGGFKAMAEAMNSEFFILTENDFRILDTTTDNFLPIQRALNHLQSGESVVWRFRNLVSPGPQLFSDKTLEYWPLETSPLTTRFVALLKRLFRPGKAHRMKGMSIYTNHIPDKKFPDVIKRLDNGDYLVRSDVLNWANNLFMIKRSFFLNEIIPQAERNIAGRLINGFPTIETELNRGKWWREKKFWIGVSNPGLFTHGRLNDRGY